MKPPLYVLPHGIEVVGEYAPTGVNRYWRVRIRPHTFFANVVTRGGGAYVRRSRVVMASKIGRALHITEIVHHVDGDKSNDSPCNLEIMRSSDHNSHHKTGAKHSIESRNKISIGLSISYENGRRSAPPPKARNNLGRFIK